MKELLVVIKAIAKMGMIVSVPIGLLLGYYIGINSSSQFGTLIGGMYGGTILVISAMVFAFVSLVLDEMERE